jgi:hypothetical protein
MKRLLLASLLALGCGESVLPAPEVVSISPSAALASEASQVVVQVDGVLPTSLDYDRSSDEENADVSLLVGTLAVGTGRWQPNGALSGNVPSLLAPGTYDVQVGFADGRTGTLAQAFTVSPGRWPTGYTVAPIAAQRAGVPFQISVHAEGPNGPEFHGNVLLHVLKAPAVTPSLSDPFQAGELTQQVTVSRPASGVVLFVTDLDGNLGASNAFDVTP